MTQKDIGLIIDFDDKEYSDEETAHLWGRFIMWFVEAAEIKKEKENAKRVKFSGSKRTKKKIAC